MLRTTLLTLTLIALAPSFAHAGDIDDASTADASPAHSGKPKASAPLRPSARKADAKAMMMPQSAAATLYPAPAGLKIPASNATRPRGIYTSPY
ncbi:hypothetical protein AWB77_03019 [Caballeronia fortuita]|uniref:Uncharacterized protein n=1 Tax=Caballeronia fortuita TaxID=1777138 RepID=A0A158BNX5_9BURK|nr:hypothetical protein [Caballeronia fortuita]SAK71426.1 hypothetical protein AWB77_03019 [Caballeronia fortuita]